MEAYTKRNLTGKIIRCIRKDASMTLQQIAKESGVSYQHLSDLEKGSKGSSEATIQKVIAAMGYPFYSDESIYIKTSQIFDEIVQAYITSDKEKRDKLLTDLAENEQWEYSLAYPLVWLARFISTGLFIKDYDFTDCEHHCQILFDTFTSLQKSFYLLVHGICQCYDYQNFKEAKEDFEQSVSFSPNHALSGYTYNQLGMIYEYEFDLLKAYELQKQAKEMMSSYSCFNRILHADNSIGRLLAHMKRYDEMKAYMLNIIDSAKFLNDTDALTTAYFNLAYYSLFAKRYEDVIKYAGLLIDMNELIYRCSYLLAWAYMEMGDLDASKAHYQVLVAKNRHQQPDVDAYEKCLKYIYADKAEAYYKTLQDWYRKSLSRGIMEDSVHALEYMIEYCEKHEMYCEGFAYQKELLKIIQKNS